MESNEGKASLEELEAHIVVVDDDQVICQQLGRLYIHSGYSVTIANSADEALQRPESRNIDLVVTDIRLPGLSGIELTKRIQENHPDVPVIVITGYGDIDTAVEVLPTLRTVHQPSDMAESLDFLLCRQSEISSILPLAQTV